MASNPKYDVHVINGTRYGNIVNTFSTEHFAREFAINQAKATGMPHVVVCGVRTVYRTDTEN